MNPIPRFTRFVMWHLNDDDTADALVVFACCVVRVMILTGTIR